VQRPPDLRRRGRDDCPVVELGYMKKGTIPTMNDMAAFTTKKRLRAIVAKRLSRMTDSTTHLVTEAETIDEFVKRKNVLVWAGT
jgi:hypothetical protein